MKNWNASKKSLSETFSYVSIYACIHSHQQEMGGVSDLDTTSFLSRHWQSLCKDSYLRVFPINIGFSSVNILSKNK